ncbi:DnaJ / Sec63 Brl domains-containing protein, putative, partial [Theobroma cacao]
ARAKPGPGAEEACSLDMRQLYLQTHPKKKNKKIKTSFFLIYQILTNFSCAQLICSLQRNSLGSGGILLLGIVGVCILLPLVLTVIYLSRSAKYTGNYVMHQTLSAYYYFMKPSLAPR